MNLKILAISILTVILDSCATNSQTNPVQPQTPTNNFIKAVDISDLPKIELQNPVFYNAAGLAEAMLTTLKNSGVNTIRLKLWHTPNDAHAGFEEVKKFSNRLHAMGFKVWLTLHYSDTWADPGQQKTPLKWQNLSFALLKDSLYNYTKKIVLQMQPDYIQIGNEINNGFLYPYGTINNNQTQFITLINQGVKAVKETAPKTKIILHFAGLEGVDTFFNKFSNTDYDLIGLSYYPIWHGKDLNQLSTIINHTSHTFNKEVVIAETAYPFTLAWNDNTTNILGSESQLILPDYPATPKGQKDFVLKIKALIRLTDKGVGFCYWGAELVAYKGKTATDASPWENQALFDFNNKALPVLEAFKE